MTAADEETTPSITETDDSEDEVLFVSHDDIPPDHLIVDRSQEPDAAALAIQHKDQGNLFLQQGRFVQAIDAYSSGLEYAPTHAVLLSNRALAYIKLENYGLALQDADHAIAADPTYAKAYYRRASANFALHHFKLARKDFRTVVKLKPKDKDGKVKLAAVEKAIREEAFAKAIEAEQTAPLSVTFDVNAIDVPSTYTGPHPTGSYQPDQEAALFESPGQQLPKEFVLAAMEYFKQQQLIHKRYVARLLIACATYYAKEPTLMRIRLPSADSRITVCGDTHGQYYDVLNIFELNGMPSKDNPYLFNGDFVDRGSFSVEVILTLLLWKMHDPACIYLTRGNHETKNMNKIYGFEGEVKAKYDDKIFQLFLEVFSWLPLAAVIEDQVFVTHGGIPVDETVMLEDISNTKRGMEPPESGIMSDLLWSDPQPFPGKSPSKRGVGFAFGPDIAQAFLQRNHLKFIIRSHEVKEEGYLVEHDGKTITVFSAPNYCDSMGNKGAFIHLDATMEPRFTKFEAVPHPNVKPMAYAAGMGGLFA
jgi:serine/threonine-protein phosphatase 5